MIFFKVLQKKMERKTHYTNSNQLVFLTAFATPLLCLSFAFAMPQAEAKPLERHRNAIIDPGLKQTCSPADNCLSLSCC